MSWVFQLSVWERSNTNGLFRMDAAVAQCMMASSLEGAGEILCSTSDTQLVCSCGMYSLLTSPSTSPAVVSPSASVAAMHRLFSQNTLQHDTTVLPAVHSTITPIPSRVPPLHPISCLIWLVDYSQHETQWLVLRHIQNSSPGLLCYFSLAPSACSLYCCDFLGISLHPLMQCWRHIALVSGVGISQVVWCQSFASCSDLSCYLLGVSRAAYVQATVLLTVANQSDLAWVGMPRRDLWWCERLLKLHYSPCCVTLKCYPEEQSMHRCSSSWWWDDSWRSAGGGRSLCISTLHTGWLSSVLYNRSPVPFQELLLSCTVPLWVEALDELVVLLPSLTSSSNTQGMRS